MGFLQKTKVQSIDKFFKIYLVFDVGCFIFYSWSVMEVVFYDGGTDRWAHYKKRIEFFWSTLCFHDSVHYVGLLLLPSSPDSLSHSHWEQNNRQMLKGVVQYVFNTMIEKRRHCTQESIWHESQSESGISLWFSVKLLITSILSSSSTEMSECFICRDGELISSNPLRNFCDCKNLLAHHVCLSTWIQRVRKTSCVGNLDI